MHLSGSEPEDLTATVLTSGIAARRNHLGPGLWMRFEQSRHITTKQAAPGHGVPGRVLAISRSCQRRTSPA
jgi:hypothetical protein